MYPQFHGGVSAPGPQIRCSSCVVEVRNLKGGGNACARNNTNFMVESLLLGHTRCCSSYTICCSSCIVNMLQCVAVLCSLLQSVAERCDCVSDSGSGARNRESERDCQCEEEGERVGRQSGEDKKEGRKRGPKKPS